MANLLTRREFLRSAGGITFLGLMPVGKGLFAAPTITAQKLPFFTAIPYLQPGPEGKLTPGAETVRLAWQTLLPADFDVQLGRGGGYTKAGKIEWTMRNYSMAPEGETRFNYVCLLTGLEQETEYRYQVRCNGVLIAEGYFTTRQGRGRKIRFAAFGDNAFGELGQKAVAYQAYRANPDFVMNTGDNVYNDGLDNEYTRYFFPVYNADAASPTTGAPLLRSMPFYTVIANHDVRSVIPFTQNPCANFDEAPDALAYYSNFYLPLNGPGAPKYPTVVYGMPARLDDFKAAVGERFPRMANYSFDYGDAHFTCLDSNIYIDPTDLALQLWIEQDLAATDARWKFVVYHHPAFNVGDEHYIEQHMRAISPILEKHGVDFVLSGHEHNYQRTMPLKFEPTDLAAAHDINLWDRRIPGKFTVDRKFDGVTVTKPEGVIYITTGAGGKHLYDAGFTNHPKLWTHADDGDVEYVAQMVTDRHSLTVFDVEGGIATMRQIDEFGNEIDRIQVTKA